jgi:hypothetical protein
MQRSGINNGESEGLQKRKEVIPLHVATNKTKVFDARDM